MPSGAEDVRRVADIPLVAERSEQLMVHDLRKPVDGVERRAKLVADVRQELAFHLVRSLRCIQRLLRVLHFNPTAPGGPRYRQATEHDETAAEQGDETRDLDAPPHLLRHKG